MDAERTYDLIERIAGLLRRDTRDVGRGKDLHPVQLEALRYLARANRVSDTPAAVGDYLGLTKGNVSQRLNGLVRQGLVRRQPDAADGRIVHLVVTAAGRRALDALAPRRRELTAMAGGPDLTALESGLTALLHELVRTRGARTFGACRTCRHHETAGGRPYCRLLDQPIPRDETDRLCREHEPRAQRG